MEHRKELIDFLQWFFDNETNIEGDPDTEDFVDLYLKSINEHPIECRNIIENEELKEYCPMCNSDNIYNCTFTPLKACNSCYTQW